MKAEEIRDLSDAELAHELADRRVELFRLRFRRATMELENPKLLGRLRRDIARIKTILHERRLARGEEGSR